MALAGTCRNRWPAQCCCICRIEMAAHVSSYFQILCTGQDAYKLPTWRRHSQDRPPGLQPHHSSKWARCHTTYRDTNSPCRLLNTALAQRCCCGVSCARCRHGDVRSGWLSWTEQPSCQSQLWHILRECAGVT